MNIKSDNELIENDYGISVDKIVTSFIMPATRPSSGIPKGIDETRFRAGRIHMMHEAAVKKQKQDSLCMNAAKKLIQCERGSNIVILTGVLHPIYFPKGETDGPTGAAALARALSFGLGIHPIIVSENATTEVMSQACLSAGLVSEWDSKKEVRPRSVTVKGFPVTDIEKTKKEAKNLLDKFNPSAVISVERKGRNVKGEYHSVRGTPRSKYEAKLDYIIDEARNRKILTIGIGDNGNEIGYGNILEDVKKIQMFGEKCQCECNSGIASIVKTDLLVPCSTSNWGAYGIEACIALLLKNPKIMHDSETEDRMLNAINNLGCADGSTILSTPTCDGTEKASLYIVDLLKCMVELSTVTKKREF